MSLRSLILGGWLAVGLMDGSGSAARAQGGAPERDAPAADAEERKRVAERMQAAQAKLVDLGGGRYRLGEIEIHAGTRELRVPCAVRHQQVPIEYLLVHETGKDHETVLTTAVSALDLQVAMLLANYSAGSSGLFARLPKGVMLPFAEQAPEKAGEHRVQLRVEWKDAAGEPQSMRLAEWFQNSDTRKPPADLEYWIFNGSRIDSRGFVAEAEGSMVAVYADPNALFNSPAAGNHLDDIWISLPANIPPEETAVTLVISPLEKSAGSDKVKP